jgi:hypothetical protein
MRRYLFFVCLFFLAACSPRNFSREQVTRDFRHDETSDSMALQRLVDKAVQEQLEQHMDLREWTDQVTVRERFSEPDTNGQQYVTERTTTTKSSHSEASAGTEYKRKEQVHEDIDSTHVAAAESTLYKEDEESVRGEVKGWSPWYVVVIALVAGAIIGFILCLKGIKK